MLSKLKKLVTDRIYKRGESYYFEKRVDKYKLDRLAANDFKIDATVLGPGSRDYDVRLNLKIDDDKINYVGYCNCPYDWEDICKHQVAVMFYFYYNDYKNVKNNISYYEFDQLMSIINTPSSTPVDLKYEIKGLLSENMVNFSLTITNSEITDENLEKLICYINPKDYSLEYDLPISLTESSRQVVNYLFYTETRGSRKRGTVLIPKNTDNLAFICNLIDNSYVICSETGRRLKLGKPLDSSIIITGDENKVDIKLAEENYRIYTDTKDENQVWWTLIEDYLHRVNLKDYKKLPSVIQIREEEKGEFIFDILPKLEERFDATIDGKLVEYNLIKAYPDIMISLDYQDGEIICNSKIEIEGRLFEGIETLDIPFEYQYQRSSEDPHTWHGIDRKSIDEYIQFLEENEFSISKNHFVIREQENINNFLTGGFPYLPEDWTVETTENFEGLKVIPLELEPVVQVSTDEIDWFDFKITYTLGGQTYTYDEIKQLLRRNKQGDAYIKIENQYFLVYDDEKTKILEENVNMESREEDKYRSEFYNILYYQKLFEEKGIKVNGSRVYNELQEDLSQKNIIKKWEVPVEVRDKLRDYQKKGYFWMRFLHKYRFGGILADDMGLGKTVQVLTLLKSLNSTRPSLVICPRSLLYNWGEEINKFFPGMKYQIYYGTPTERIDLRKDMDQFDIIITTYSIISRDVDYFDERIFSYCILDEAQQIKNHRTIRAASVKKIQAERRLVLTGTPIENSVDELWSIFDFLMPGYLGTHSSFSKKYKTPIMENNDLNTLNQLKKRIAPFILRRNKQEVLSELPKKMEQITKVAMTNLQADAYQTILEEVRQQILESVQEMGFNRSQFQILSALTKLRQVCNHPKLVMDNLEQGINSGKIEALLEIVEEATASGHKILVFSQFVKMLRIIETEFKNNDITYEYLDGSTRNRMERVKRFNSDPSINTFLISLKAGGTGLNLTSADMVIHVDPWWNPMVEKQATDRVHRIGQENKVMVYKLITSGTIEEKILKLQQRKQNIFDSVIEQNMGKVEKLTWQDIQEIFQF